MLTNLLSIFQKLIQAPQSIGGHFQFKYEKSWDITTGPSVYDKYFEINMESLAIALSTVPFYERNDIEDSVFSQTDLQTMNSRSIRYKQKYYNDKSYTTPELDAQDKILKLMQENDSKCEQEDESEFKKTRSVSESKDIVFEDSLSIKTETEAEGSGKVLKVDFLDRDAGHGTSTLEAKDTKIIHKMRMQEVDKTPVGKLDNKEQDDDDLDELFLCHVDSKVDIAMKNVEVEIKNTVHVENQLLQGKKGSLRNLPSIELFYYAYSSSS